jgi:hypothetical protein
MTIFAPFPDKMIGVVPIICPACHLAWGQGDLSFAQKQFLIDASGYHEILEEYHHLQTLDSILRRFPGTRNRLITSKIGKQLYGPDDEVAVANLIDATDGFHDFLKQSHFEHYGRYSFVHGLVQRYQDDIASMLVTCSQCPNQYAILPYDYYMSIGH